MGEQMSGAADHGTRLYGSAKRSMTKLACLLKPSGTLRSYQSEYLLGIAKTNLITAGACVRVYWEAITGRAVQ
jgi:hypothetical protein